MLSRGAQISCQDGTAVVTFAGETVCITKDPGRIAFAPTVLAVYGDGAAPVPDCGVLIMTDPEAPYLPDPHTYVGENDIEICLTPDGACEARRIWERSDRLSSAR